MKRNVILFAATVLFLLYCVNRDALAQTEETRKFEVGAHFTSLTIREDFNPRTEPGLGGRITYNVTDNFAVEAEGNFLHSDNSTAFRTGGHAIEGLFGVKVGRRFKSFGIFAKARPGLISFSRGAVDFIPSTTTLGSLFPFEVRTRRLTHFAADLGGVLEFYPSRRIITRFDFGDTIIRYGQIKQNSFTMTPAGTFVPLPVIFPSDTSHNFQFTAGVGFRF